MYDFRQQRTARRPSWEVPFRTRVWAARGGSGALEKVVSMSQTSLGGSPPAGEREQGAAVGSRPSAAPPPRQPLLLPLPLFLSLRAAAAPQPVSSCVWSVGLEAVYRRYRGSGAVGCSFSYCMLSRTCGRHRSAGGRSLNCCSCCRARLLRRVHVPVASITAAALLLMSPP